MNIVSNTRATRIGNRFHARDLHLDGAVTIGRSSTDFDWQSTACRPALSIVDVDEGGNGTIREQRLYQLIRQPKPIVDRQFEIKFLDGGEAAYAFTFG